MVTLATTHITDTKRINSKVYPVPVNYGQESEEVIIKMLVNSCFTQFALGIINN